MKFNGFSISQDLLANIEAMGYKKATDIQYKAIPPILDNEDVLAIAQTGTGKTAAFAIPIIEKITNSPFKQPKGVKCVVMVPTRELAIQIEEVFKTIAKGLKLVTVSLHGGVEQDRQISRLVQGSDVVIATPGRLFDLHHQGYLTFENLQILVLDEADHMLDLGFYKDITDLIARIPKRRQTLFFSATINEKVKKLAYSIVSKAVRIQISPKDPVSKNIDHYVMHIEMDDKRFFLERLVSEHPDEKILVFVRTKVRAERVVSAMARVGIETVSIHGDKEQADRFINIEKFRSGEIKVMITTDVSARGLDIAFVEYVVNYDLPDKVENYVHRIGRTGRGDHRGHAVSFCSTEEKSMLLEIEEFVGKKIENVKIEKSEYQNTLDFTADKPQNDWQTLLDEADKFENGKWKKR